MNDRGLTFMRAAIMQLFLEQPMHSGQFKDELGELFKRHTLFKQLNSLEKLGLVTTERRRVSIGERVSMRSHYVVTKDGKATLKLFKRQHKKILRKLCEQTHEPESSETRGTELSFIRASIMQLLVDRPMSSEGVCDTHGALLSLASTGSTMKVLRKLGVIAPVPSRKHIGKGGLPKLYAVTEKGKEELELFKKQYKKLLGILCE